MGLNRTIRTANALNVNAANVNGAPSNTDRNAPGLDEKVTVIVLTNSDNEGHLQPESFLISGIANEIASYYFPN